MSESLARLHEASGKVREMYNFGETMLMVASDRMSAFDVIMPTPIPDKGRVLTALSAFWFEHTVQIVPNHLISIEQNSFPDQARLDPELAGRSMYVRRLTMMPIECVVRGYLAGSGWKDYQATGSVCGHRLPPGLREADRLPEPIFTPATKSTSGHDINIDAPTARLLVGDDARYEKLEQLSLDLYEFASGVARDRGIIIADTKFEFGMDMTGDLVLGDEVLTPDSSRFWPADEYDPGRPQPSFDKQFLRDWLEASGWDKRPPAPELPDDVVSGTRERYAEAYQRLTGEPFSAYLRRNGVPPS
ncbi:MAG TPA: phosphoribosylaminoimidazolesuccinocarboxamide synthase [Gaiellales bacterium]|jgi:phosphoribosylaminoimidazole-succinocarboxamide synthase|nr:phosphoribosylaminoimidazolesuccinocarboxamide synthase [Gaiellales bacterium]